MGIFSNWQITSLLVIAGLYASIVEKSPISGWFVRTSGPDGLVESVQEISARKKGNRQIFQPIRSTNSLAVA